MSYDDKPDWSWAHDRQLQDIYDLKQQLKQAREERDAWKERACVAENRLNSISDAVKNHLDDQRETYRAVKKFDIWSEGFAATGDVGYHKLEAKGVEAASFKEACIKHYGNNKLFDAERLTYWGCRLFDNPTDAARTFG